MFNAKIGQSVARISPPSGGSHGYCQSGTVKDVTDTEIVVEFQADIRRTGRFSRSDGVDLLGLGSFLVHPDT